MDGTLFWTLAVLASVFVGLSKGGVPAFGMLAVPVMSLVISPVTAAGLLLPVFVFSDIFGVWAYRHEFNRTVLKIAVFGILAGTCIGWATAHIVSENFVRLLIGVIGLSFSLNLLLRRRVDGPPQSATWGKGLFWTTVAGFTSFVSHAGAPPWQVWVLPQKLSKLAFAGTTTFAFAIMNASKIVPYYALGQFAPQNLRIAATLLLPAVVSVFIGIRLIRLLPEKVFFAIVTWALLAVSAKLVWDGLGV